MAQSPDSGFGWRELLTGLALVAGWTLLTFGIAELVSELAWPISGGLLLLSLCGWGFLKDLFTEGLYVLSQGRRE